MRKGNECWKVRAGRVRYQGNAAFAPEKHSFRIIGFVRRFFVPQFFLVFAFCVTAEASKNAVTNAIPPVHAFIHVPPKLHRFSTWQKLNPIWWLGNADDPEPPKTYRPGKRTRMVTWYFRNPFHNFTFYVIGIGDKVHLRVGRYADRVANPNGGWNWAVCRYQWLQLPFVDYHGGRFEFYVGWRNGGNFGMKLNLLQHQAKAKAKTNSEADRADLNEE